MAITTYLIYFVHFGVRIVLLNKYICFGRIVFSYEAFMFIALLFLNVVQELRPLDIHYSLAGMKYFQHCKLVALNESLLAWAFRSTAIAGLSMSWFKQYVKSIQVM